MSVDRREVELRLGDSIERGALARIIDANANRAREALRVLEDYARFSLDDAPILRLALVQAPEGEERIRELQPSGGVVGALPDYRLEGGSRPVMTSGKARICARVGSGTAASGCPARTTK